MGWIIARTQKDKKTQIFMCSSQNTGEWRDWDCDEGVNLPVLYDHKLDAVFEIARQQAMAPEWEYEVREYLR